MTRPMTAGIHLPQAGPAANPESIKRVAMRAEALGYADIWVSDHLAVQTNAAYPPSPYIYEPLITLTWAAAVTERVKLGTTVLVLPMRNPLFVAKALASIDQLSGGRMILGTAAAQVGRLCMTTNPNRDFANGLGLSPHGFHFDAVNRKGRVNVIVLP